MALKRWRIAIVVSHPIQYQAPWFRALAQAVDLQVYFCHCQDALDQAAAGFETPFEWDTPLLDGYPYQWLKNRASNPNVGSFRGCDTPEIDDLLAAGRFDGCIVSGWYLKSYVQAIRACWKHHVRVLMRGDSHLGTRRFVIKSAVKWMPYRLFLNRIDAHLYVGQANKAYLRHYGVPEEKLFFVPHFVDNDFFRNGAERARQDGEARAVRHRFGIPEDAKVALFVGKIVATKRVEDFIASLARAGDSSVHGLVVGCGPHLPEMQSLASQLRVPVHFAGFRNQSALPAFYAAGDLLVVPGPESWGLVVNEAMACGLPAIVNDAAGCGPDLIEEGQTGHTFPLGDVQALACRLKVAWKQLATRRAEVAMAVQSRISSYSCWRAVEATLSALEQGDRATAAHVESRCSEQEPRQ